MSLFDALSLAAMIVMLFGSVAHIALMGKVRELAEMLGLVVVLGLVVALFH